MGMKLSLILSAYEQPISLAKVLRGVSRQTRAPDEVFIADDGSGDETRALIEQWRREARFPVRHLWHPHEGFRKVILLNRAVADATGQYLVFLDGDCIPHPRFLADHERNLALDVNGQNHGRAQRHSVAHTPDSAQQKTARNYWMQHGFLE